MRLCSALRAKCVDAIFLSLWNVSDLSPILCHYSQSCQSRFVLFHLFSRGAFPVTMPGDTHSQAVDTTRQDNNNRQETLTSTGRAHEKNVRQVKNDRYK